MPTCLTGQWCYYCYANRKGKSNYAGHRWHRRAAEARILIEEAWIMLTRRTDAASGGRVVSLGAEVAALYPSIEEFIVTTAWPDGKPRRTGTLTVFAEEGQVKLCLSDRAQGLVGFCSGRSLSEAADALEQLLSGNTLEWRKTEGGRSK